jgi:hypothetical protein
MTTIREINELNQRFWEREIAAFNRRIADDALRETAFGRFFDEQSRRVPLYDQAPIEKFLADAERDRGRFLSHQGRQGGQAKKPDALQQEILKLVQGNPKITEAMLKAMLTRERFPGLIADIDEETIWFVQPDGSKDGRPKQAAISGLKHRLSRAKKNLRSR